ncbi:MAG: trypsin-like peptidase domain-containing protein [Planctomycetia bacterium]|nr:trypsin-like peptidase domain-containing protein [Planctomycetia bacterium]MCC7315667.1 trypsin-like peptidase domain-containing protein [Planctomycetota bacterium]OQZ05837.1 MAG: hypothetical protein B6D36_08090 [Planctomycetes bacterium UTPLA1]
MFRNLAVVLVLGGAVASSGGCARSSATGLHSTDRAVHAVSASPPTCPICALYSLHRTVVVRVQSDEGQGTGVVIGSSGDILTSAHVVAGLEEVRVGTLDGNHYTGKVAFRDVENDLAIVRIETPGLVWKTVMLDFDEDVPVGTRIFVIGHPVGLGWTVTQGIVSGLREAGDIAPTELIQTDAPISPGNSGGPLLDEHGHLVGIIRSKLVGPGVENVSFAIPSRVVKVFLDRVPARTNSTSNAFLRSAGVLAART